MWMSSWSGLNLAKKQGQKSIYLFMTTIESCGKVRTVTVKYTYSREKKKVDPSHPWNNFEQKGTKLRYDKEPVSQMKVYIEKPGAERTNKILLNKCSV